MKRALQILLCLLTALHLCGGPLGVVQLVAWGQMIWDYSQNRGLAEAVMDTFDGEHPCAMCCKISKAEQNKQKQNPLPLEKTEKVSKWLGLLPTWGLPAPAWTAAELPQGFASPTELASQWMLAPEALPPRGLV